MYTLRQVLEACPPILRAKWSARWLEMAVRTAVTPNAALQPRAVVTLGVMNSRRGVICLERLGNTGGLPVINQIKRWAVKID